jgi:hypothetical protein
MRPLLLFIALLLWDTIAFGLEPVTVSMLDWSNVYRAKSHVPIAPIDESLTAAAQDQASHLGRYGYTGSGGHTFGNGTSTSRAAKHGFTGTLVGPGGMLGEIIACGQQSPQAAFASWARHDSGHYLRLLEPSYNVCGFGHSRNAWGQDIWVAMYGRQNLAAAKRLSGEAAGPATGTAPAAFSVQAIGPTREEIPWQYWSPPNPPDKIQQAPQQAPAFSRGTCGPNGCDAGARPYITRSYRTGPIRGFSGCGGSGRGLPILRRFRGR